jgi:hypothetical protein
MKYLCVCFLLIYSSLFAGTMSQQIADDAGQLFKVTVTAPRVVDARIFTAFQSNNFVEQENSDVKSLNVSGYRIRITPIGNLQCKSHFVFYQPIPATLDPGASMDIECQGCVGVDAAVFPATGNVNVRIGGPHHSTCKSSNRPKLRMDAVSCYFSDCEGEPFSEVQLTIIDNPSSTEAATFSAVVNQTIVNF